MTLLRGIQRLIQSADWVVMIGYMEGQEMIRWKAEQEMTIFPVMRVVIRLTAAQGMISCLEEKAMTPFKAERETISSTEAQEMTL